MDKAKRKRDWSREDRSSWNTDKQKSYILNYIISEKFLEDPYFQALTDKPTVEQMLENIVYWSKKRIISQTWGDVNGYEVASFATEHLKRLRGGE